MKRSVGLLVIAFLLVPVLGAQETQKSGGDQEQQQPTLGPPAPGTAAGPRTATVTDYRKLSRMRSIYIERMDNALSEKLILSLGKKKRMP
jgi:hypothetical protein